ncbi:MAG: HAMP domain-containing histidine kinase, partial [Cyclobacteriaceae bacterium]|nr:HAMP domain-containing histidine kinase [Cyclobacteriaceae bacterium]
LYLVKINRNFETKKDEIAQELLEANEFLKKTNDELDHFVYSASHDLKAPLSSILGLINIAKLEVKEDKSLEYFDMINDRVYKLNSFIKDIINLSRNARLQIESEEVSLSSIVKNVIENNRYMSNADSIKFKTDVIDDKIKIDKSRLEIILNNLVSNAIKYHKTEGDRYVYITIQQSQTHLFIKVKDNGIGIHLDHQDKVFNMFYRGHENSEGSGLGLYIVSEVINKMNGEITLISDEGQGTEINIKIPL